MKEVGHFWMKLSCNLYILNIEDIAWRQKFE